MASTTAFFTGLSGLIANARRLDVIGNNIANVNTTSFKSNRMSFAPNFSRNFSLGTAPGANTGGTNPGQVGLGVGIAGTQRSFTNGAIGATGVSTDVAIEGDGFFIVDIAGSRYFTRDGEFLRSPDNDLVTKTGAKVMGYGIDDSFNIVEGNLVELNVPLGTLTLAEATQNVTFNGNLNASGTVGSTGSVHTSRAFYSDALGTTPIDGTEDLTATDIYVADGSGGFTLAFDSSVNPKIITVSGIEKGGKDLGDHTFAFSATAVAGADAFGTTMNDYVAWLEDVLGLDSTAVGDSSDLGGGIAISAGGEIVITGNEGTVQELGIETGDMTVGDFGTGVAQPFVMSQTGDPDGESVRTSFVVYDSLGTPLTIDVSLVLQATTDSGGTSWQFIAESNDSPVDARVLGMGELVFDANGRFVSASSDTFAIRRENGATDPLNVTMNFTDGTNAVSSLTDTTSNIAAVFQDGSAIGTLSNFSIGTDGILSGSFTNGLTRTIGQIALAKFTNPAGLVDAGNNYFQVGPNSGTALITAAQQFGTGRLVGGALELSNVDLSQEFINMILASTGYSAASRVITTTDELINQLLTIGR
ncbi:MAG: flagellar hook-basal body complex protein [Phycisphaerae bacterium]|jgi:flagellar hook protein FlgE|nr:flagellar hook-basal body complex protein [Phycisphaerae bacterium]